MTLAQSYVAEILSGNPGEFIMENKELALIAARAIDDKKGMDVKIIDIAEKSQIGRAHV